MENVQFSVGTADFLNGVVANSGQLGLGELTRLFSKMAQKIGVKKDLKVRCSVKSGTGGAVFSVANSDLNNVVGELSGFIGDDNRAKFCKKIAKCITEHKNFAFGSTAGGDEEFSEVFFPLHVATGDLTGVKFDVLDKKTLISLKKKILESMLGETPKGGEKGRPVKGNLRVDARGLFVEVGQEQAVALLKRSLAKLSPDQLVALDSRLGGAITSFPDNKSA